MLTNFKFLEKGAPWPPKSEETRLKLYEQNRLLFEAKHDEVYHNKHRLFDQKLTEEQRATFEIVLNWHKRLSLLWASLLFGEPPTLRVGEKGSKEQSWLEALVIKNRFMSVSREVTIDLSRYGVGIFKIRFDGKRAVIEAQPPANWFPVVDPTNIKNVQAHVLAITYQETVPGVFNIGTKEKNRLKVEIHEIGKLTTRIYELNGQRIGAMVGEEKTVVTGVEEFLVQPIVNLSTSDKAEGFDDYQDIDGIIQELEGRISQIGRILDKHADPSMHGPADALQFNPDTGEWELKVKGGKFYAVGKDDQPPGYIVWDGQLEAAFKQIDTLMEQLYFISQTSPAAFGQLKSGLAESGSALRRLMMAPLLKASLIRMDFDPVLKTVLQTAAALEASQGVSDAKAVQTITVEWKDGLPRDDTEETANETQMYAAGLTSREAVLRRYYNLEGEELQAELERINEERKPPTVAGPAVKLPYRGADDDHQHN